VRRKLALLLLLVGVAITTWFRSERVLIVPDKTLHFKVLKLPPERVLKAHLGAFKLEHAWQMTLGSHRFGGYSALLPLPDGRMLAISDAGRFLTFVPPGGPAYTPRVGTLLTAYRDDKRGVDSESAVRDPETGTIWLGMEFRNAVIRLAPNWTRNGSVAPKAMAAWEPNSGPEAMARLLDGRFLVLAEGAREWLWPRTHEGVLFAGDPVENPDAAIPFTLEGPTGFVPVDMVQIPDGRVLVLMRTLIWPVPEIFAGRIAIGDPAQIREGGTWHLTEVARLASTLPVDNFEGMAVTPRADGRLTVWLISDDNQTQLQRTLLWKLVVDPADLPR
jgi:hypothetical protein